MMSRKFIQEFGHWLRLALTRDFLRKLLALFLALLLYGAVTYRFSRAEPLRLSGVPVELQLPEGIVNLNGGVPPVTLVVTGSTRVLNSLSSRDFIGKVRIREGSFMRGTPYRLKLSSRDFKTPPGVEINDIEPRELLLELEPIVSRRVPIEVRFDSLDRLPRDYQLDRIICVPDEVQVSGPESLISELRTVKTQPIPLDRTVTDGFDYTAPLRTPDGMRILPERVAVRIEVARKYATRTFKGIPLRLLLSPEQRRERLSVELQGPPLAEVSISGPETQLSVLKGDNLRPYLDLSDLREPGVFSISLGCVMVGVDDSELRVKSVRPGRISVRLAAEK